MDETIDREAQEIERSWQSYIGPWLLETEPTDSFWKAVRVLWERAPDWHTMTELNRRYLQRRLPVCAGYRSPPDEETDYFVNLLRLHDYGIISTNSCPGWEIQLDDSPAFARQRSYLTSSIPTRTSGENTPEPMRNFVEKLMTSQELYAFIRFKYDEAPDGVARDPEINGRMVYGHCCSFPDSASEEWIEEEWDLDFDSEDQVISVTQEQRRQNSRTWNFHGHQDVYLSGSDFDDDNNPFPASHAADPLHISVFAKDWYYREIGQLIEGLLIESGIMPEFVAGG